MKWDFYAKSNSQYGDDGWHSRQVNSNEVHESKQLNDNTANDHNDNGANPGAHHEYGSHDKGRGQKRGQGQHKPHS